MRNTSLPTQLQIDGSTRQQKLYDDAIELLQWQQAYHQEPFYLCTSFGKDSIVAHRLCDEAGVQYDAHHNVTGIDPPELVYFGRKHYPDVTRHMYKYSMWQLISMKGILPMRHRRYCCEYLKEDGGIGRVCVMGIRADESTRRRKTWAPITTRGGRAGNELRMFDNDDFQTSMQRCMIQDKLTINPIYHWTLTDLWDFIHDRKLPYCCLYDEGFHRLGCIGCPMGREKWRRRDFERWPGFYRLYYKAAKQLVERGRIKCGIHSADELMNWWLSDDKQDVSIVGQEEMVL